MRHVRVLLAITLTISLIVLVVLALVRMPKRECSSVSVVAHSVNESIILDEQDVKAMIANTGIETVNSKIKDVDLAAITELLSKNPYIKKVNFAHFSGTRLIIDYTLRNIILHVFADNGEQYLVDDEGVLLPFKTKFTDDLIIANGNVRQHYKKGAIAGKELQPVVALSNALLADEFYKNQFRQIYLNNNKQIELVATFGNQVILFGDTTRMDKKLKNLKHVYQEGLSRKGYDQYAQLDVRYQNRVIAQ